jgi:superfamily I DNA/RNA helicase
VGQKGFLDAAPVRQVLAFIRCVLRPEDDYRLLCALRAFDPEGEARRALQAHQAGGSLVAAARSVAETHDGVRVFLEDLDRYCALAQTARAEEVIGAWCEASGVSDDPDVGRLLEVCSRYDRVEEMMQEALLGREADCERRGRAAPRGEAITLMTLHAAKGLEFPVVFIVGAEEGLIPYRDRDADLAEERRLLYVGITRGRDEVLLTAAKRRVRYGRQEVCEVSPFLQDLCGSVIEVEQRERKQRRGETQLSLF